MENLVGKWKLVNVEGAEEYCDAIGNILLFILIIICCCNVIDSIVFSILYVT